MQTYKKYKSLTAIILSILLIFSLSFCAFADAYIPPVDDLENHRLERSIRLKAEDLNIKFSNFVEVGVKDYDIDSTPESEKIKMIYKHCELNGIGEQKSDTDGTKYITVTKETFEKEYNRMFSKTINAEKIEGYKKGYVNFTAKSFGPTISVFGQCASLNYEGDGHYTAKVNIYYMPDEDITSYYQYGTYNFDFNKEHENDIVGYADVKMYYPDSSDDIDIDSVIIKSYHTDVDTSMFPNSDENKAYILTQDKTQASTKKETIASESTTQKVTETISSTNDKKVKDDNKQPYLIYLAICIALIAILVTVIIILIVRQKKKKDLNNNVNNYQDPNQPK